MISCALSEININLVKWMAELLKILIILILYGKRRYYSYRYKHLKYLPYLIKMFYLQMTKNVWNNAVVRFFTKTINQKQTLKYRVLKSLLMYNV